VSPYFRKVALIAASLGLLVSLYVALSPDDGGEPGATTTAPAQATTTDRTTTTAPATTAPPTTTAPEETGVLTIRLDVAAGTVPDVRRLSVRRGREVELVVTSEVADHVHVHGYDLFADVGPGSPGTLRFTADAPGRFEIELEESHLQIAELEVRP
jgi:hypothetical protein